MSHLLLGIIDQQAIISNIHEMLADAIQSSLYNTPAKIQNMSLLRHRQYLEVKWVLGEDVEDEAGTRAEMDEDILWMWSSLAGTEF